MNDLERLRRQSRNDFVAVVIAVIALIGSLALIGAFAVHAYLVARP